MDGRTNESATKRDQTALDYILKDPLRETLQWSRITYKNKLLKTINTLFILLGIFHILLYFYAIIKFGGKNIIPKYTAIIGVQIYGLSSHYIHYRNEFHMEVVYDKIEKLDVKFYATEDTLKKVVQLSTTLNTALKLLAIFASLAAILLTPWLGDESEFYIVIKILSLLKCPHWVYLLFIIFFNIYIIHTGLTMVTSGFRLLYSCQHGVYLIMYFNDVLISLQNLHIHFDCSNLRENDQYQNEIKKLLIQCIKWHREFLTISKMCNQQYYSIFLSNALSGIFLFSSVTFFIYSNVVPSSNFRMAIVLIAGMIMVFALCSYAQDLIDKGDEIQLNVSQFPWILWNKTNIKLGSIFLLGASRGIQVKANDIVVINANFLIRLSQKIWTVFAFLVSVVN